MRNNKCLYGSSFTGVERASVLWGNVLPSHCDLMTGIMYSSTYGGNEEALENLALAEKLILQKVSGKLEDGDHGFSHGTDVS